MKSVVFSFSCSFSCSCSSLARPRTHNAHIRVRSKRGQDGHKKGKRESFSLCLLLTSCLCTYNEQGDTHPSSIADDEKEENEEEEEEFCSIPRDPERDKRQHIRDC